MGKIGIPFWRHLPALSCEVLRSLQGAAKDKITRYQKPPHPWLAPAVSRHCFYKLVESSEHTEFRVLTSRFLLIEIQDAHRLQLSLVKNER